MTQVISTTNQPDNGFELSPSSWDVIQQLIQIRKGIIRNALPLLHTAGDKQRRNTVAHEGHLGRMHEGLRTDFTTTLANNTLGNAVGIQPTYTDSVDPDVVLSMAGGDMLAYDRPSTANSGDTSYLDAITNGDSMRQDAGGSLQDDGDRAAVSGLDRASALLADVERFAFPTVELRQRHPTEI